MRIWALTFLCLLLISPPLIAGPDAEVRAATPTNGDIQVPSHLENWWESNRYNSSDFLPDGKLLELKRQQGIRISMVLPTLREGRTIGDIVSRLKQVAMGEDRLVDEIVIIDSGSDDNTVEAAEAAGGDAIRVVQSQDILPHVGTRRGKGENLWKALHETTGDILLFIDADIRNISTRYVYGLLGPLLYRPEVLISKAYYKRPITDPNTGEILSLDGGGRISECVGRPFVLNGWWPDLSLVIAPYSGEFAIRRSAMEQIPIPVGYGIETANLIDIYQLWGLQSIAQVDLNVRQHRNQSTVSLGGMGAGIRKTIFRRGLWYFKGLSFWPEGDSYHTFHMVERPENPRAGFGEFEQYQLELNSYKIDSYERPPMITIPAYRKKHNRKITLGQRMLPCSVNLAMRSVWAGLLGRPNHPSADPVPRLIPKGSEVLPDGALSKVRRLQ